MTPTTEIALFAVAAVAVGAVAVYELTKKPPGSLVGAQVIVPVGKITITSGSPFVVAPPADALATVVIASDDGVNASGALMLVESQSGHSTFAPPTPTICSFPVTAVDV